MLKKLFFGLLFLIAVGAIVLFTSPFDHIRNFISWGPHSIYDFKTHPFRTIEASPTPEPWAIAENYNKKQISDSLLKIFDDNDTKAFLVIQDGKIKYEKYWDGYDNQTISGSFSAAKSIISMLIGKAIEEGKIKSVEDKVADYLPEFLEDGKENVKIKDLLTMSSGSNWDEKSIDYFSLNAQAYYADDLDYVVDKFEQKEPAGKTWEYRSGDTQVLGLIVEKVFANNISALVKKNFYDKMGFENQAKWLTDGEMKHEKSFCCFNGVARDYARFGELILTNGKWKGKNIMDSTYMAAATTAASYLVDPTENNANVDFYGYQFWIYGYEGMKIPTMNGLWGQYVFGLREKNTIIVRLGDTKKQRRVHHFPTEMKAYVEGALQVID